MFGITDILTYTLGVIFIVLLPGPNSLYVLSVAAQRGVKQGYLGACGIFVGDTVLMILSAAGVASLLKANPDLFNIIKYLGAAYLAWIGLNLLRAAWNKWCSREVMTTVVATKVDDAHPFKRALIISLMNPKAIMFFISFFIQFVDPAYAYPALTFIVLGSIVQICSMLYLSTLIFAGVQLADAFNRRRKISASAMGGVGAMFIGFGAKLATTTLS
ncbi:MAG: leucine efflux protein LeuE [Burkholderiales bacterium]